MTKDEMLAEIAAKLPHAAVDLADAVGPVIDRLKVPGQEAIVGTLTDEPHGRFPVTLLLSRAADGLALTIRSDIPPEPEPRPSAANGGNAGGGGPGSVPPASAPLKPISPGAGPGSA